MNKNHISRNGERSTAKNGQIMTIICYRSSTDIDVRFEDGTVREHCRYDNFKNGNISNPNYSAQSNRIGETVTARNGQVMTIICYRSSTDIDVRFEDGTVREHCRYDNFQNGLIQNPNYRNSLIGEESKANNGQKMSIIEYRSATDIDIMFEDGTIRTHIRYDNFKNGQVSNPNRLISIKTTEDNTVLLSDLSIGMKKVVSELQSKHIQFQTEKTFGLCFYRGYLPFDVFIPNIGIIEFDGEQHFKNRGFYQSEASFVEAMIRDQVKNCFCEVHNIPLLRIRYDQENRIHEMVEKFISNPHDYLTRHNDILSNEEYYSIRQSAELLD